MSKLFKEQKIKFQCKKCGTLSIAITGTKRSKESLCSNCFGRDKDLRPRELNDLSGAEWAKFSLSVQEYPDIRSDKQRKHGACFSTSMAKQFIKKYTKKTEVVLDPFVGVGTTIDACIELERKSYGIDINREFTRITRSGINKHKKNGGNIAYNCDAEDLDKWIKPDSIDFILTSPPYASLLKTVKNCFAYKWKEHSKITSIGNPKPYTNKKNDLGNMSYNDFFIKLDKIMVKLYKVLKNGKYMAWIVKDYRDLKNGIPYVNFHGDIINCAQQNGFTLWDTVIYNQTKFRPLVCLGYPSDRYYHNIGHSYILVFRKNHNDSRFKLS